MSKIKNEFSLIAGSDTTGNAGALAKANESSTVAEMQSRLLIAKHFPRNPVFAMDSILNAFSRPGLAEQAEYEYSRGGSAIIGPSIRSAEAIAGLWGNMEFGFNELSRGVGSDGNNYSEVQAFAIDLQTNTKRHINFRVPHYRDTKKGGYPITSERDIYELVSNQAQRRVRACILAVIPTDVTEKAMAQAKLTLESNVLVDAESVQSLIDAFSEFGVDKEALSEKIQQRIETITAGQMVTLRGIYRSLRDGRATPSDWFSIEKGEAAKDMAGSVSEIRKSAAKNTAKPLENSPSKPANELKDAAPKKEQAVEGANNNPKDGQDQQASFDDDVPFA